MELVLSAVGQKMPPWVEQGFGEYQRRFPPHLPLRLCQVPICRRGKNSSKMESSRLRREQGEALLATVPAQASIIALDVAGTPWSTRQLAKRIQVWQQQGRDVAFLVGGPDGLSEECLQAAQQRWSLGAITLPHPLVRVILAEQLYRAWSITVNHPYHRE